MDNWLSLPVSWLSLRRLRLHVVAARVAILDECPDGAEPADVSGGTDLEVWVLRGSALVVASVGCVRLLRPSAGLPFRMGQIRRVPSLWPLSVDGLLLPATVGLLKPARHAGRRASSVVWDGVLPRYRRLSGQHCWQAPALAWKPSARRGMAARRPLLFSVELLAHRSGDRALSESPQRDPFGAGQGRPAIVHLTPGVGEAESADGA